MTFSDNNEYRIQFLETKLNELQQVLLEKGTKSSLIARNELYQNTIDSLILRINSIHRELLVLLQNHPTLLKIVDQSTNILSLKPLVAS